MKLTVIHFRTCLICHIIHPPPFSLLSTRHPELPHSPPTLFTERDRYDVGDILQANCTTPPSKPGASVSFFLNGQSVSVCVCRRVSVCVSDCMWAARVHHTVSPNARCAPVSQHTLPWQHFVSDISRFRSIERAHRLRRDTDTWERTGFH